MPECPPGVHSMFDFCPGDCTEPVEDERHETLLIEWTSNISEISRWLRERSADYGPIHPSDPLYRWGVFQRSAESQFAFEPGDTLCWDGTRVWLHSSRRQEVETCEAKEDRRLKFGTGTITAVAKDNEEGQMVRTAAALSDAERAGIIAEGEETETEGA